MTTQTSQPKAAATAAHTAEPSPLMEMLRVAAPTVAMMASYTMMTFTDKFLVARLGPEPVYVGAQGNGGLISWVPISIVHGMLTIINTYVSQNLGAGRPERGPAYAWNGLWVACIYWLLVLVPYGFALPWILRMAEVPPGQIEMAAEYGRILVFGSILTMATRSLGQFFFGMQQARVVMVAGIVANIFNVFAAAVFAYGNGAIADFSGSWLGAIMQPVVGAAHHVAVWLHIPRLGVAGSAWGTLLATVVEMAIPTAVFLGPKFNAKYKTRSSWRWSTGHVKDLVRLGWPGGAMFGNEMICWGYFMVHLVSKFGEEHSTAGWIAHQYMSLSFMPAVGISVACTAVVGKYMGMGKPDLAAQRAWLGVRVAIVYMISCGILMVVFRHQLIAFFIDAKTPPESVARVIALGSMFLIATAAFQAFDAIAMTLSGALRGAGDTLIPGLATLVLSWLVIVGAGTVLVAVLPERIKPMGGWIGAASYIILLATMLLLRFVGGKWKTNKVLKESSVAGH